MSIPRDITLIMKEIQNLLSRYEVKSMEHAIQDDKIKLIISLSYSLKERKHYL